MAGHALFISEIVDQLHLQPHYLAQWQSFVGIRISKETNMHIEMQLMKYKN